MGIRETLNENQGIVTGVTIGIIVVVLIILVLQLRGPGLPAAYTQMYYTVDGETWFLDSIERIPPFEHRGQEAVRAFLFTCDGGQTKFIGFMERFNEAGRRRLENMEPGSEEFNRSLSWDDGAQGLEVRHPDMPEGMWISADAGQGPRLRQPRCPDGSDARQVWP